MLKHQCVVCFRGSNFYSKVAELYITRHTDKKRVKVFSRSKFTYLGNDQLLFGLGGGSKNNLDRRVTTPILDAHYLSTFRTSL